MIFTSYGRQFHLSVISSESDQAEVFDFMQGDFRINEPITNAIRLFFTFLLVSQFLLLRVLRARHLPVLPRYMLRMLQG
jgi:hypothetical protein